MYIYKKCKNKYLLIDTINSKDEFIIEEYLIKLIRQEKHLKEVYNIQSKYTGLYTIYYIGGDYVLLVSEYVLNEDGTIKQSKT